MTFDKYNSIIAGKLAISNNNIDVSDGVVLDTELVSRKLNCIKSGVIFGKFTGRYDSTWNYYEIQLFNPAFGADGSLIYIVKGYLSSLSAIEDNTSVTGPVWRDTYSRDGQQDLAPYMMPGYALLADDFKGINDKYGNVDWRPYLCPEKLVQGVEYHDSDVPAYMEPVMRLLAYPDTFKSAKSIIYETLFNWGNSDHEWYELLGMVSFGFVVGSTENPTLESCVSSVTYNKSDFQSSGIACGGLTENTSYYGRGFVKRGTVAGAIETIYTDNVKFTTAAVNRHATVGSENVRKLTDITNNSVRISAYFQEFGENGGVLEYGVVYSDTNSLPTVDNAIKIVNTFSNSDVNIYKRYSTLVSGLQPNKTYFFRSFVKDASGYYFNYVADRQRYVYSGDGFIYPDANNVLAVTTNQVAGLPVIQSYSVINVSRSGFGVDFCPIVSNGGSTTTERGFVIATHTVPTVADRVVLNTGTDITQIVAEIDSLVPGTTYYIRPYAKNSNGIAYGWEKSVKTEGDAVLTNISAKVYDNNADLTCTISNAGGGTIVKRGFVLSYTDLVPTIGLSQTIDIKDESQGIGTYTLTARNLWFGGKKYYYRAYVIKNSPSNDPQYSDAFTFETAKAQSKPTILIKSCVLDLKANTITVIYSFLSDGGSPITAKIAISAANALLTTTIPTTAVAIAAVVGVDYSYEFDIADFVSGNYNIGIYASNAFGTEFETSNVLLLNRPVINNANDVVLPALGCSYTMLIDKVSLSAAIYDNGEDGFAVTEKKVELFNLTNNTSQILALSESADGLSLFQHNSAIVLPVNSEFRLKITVTGNYKEQFIGLVNTKEVTFSTPNAWNNTVKEFVLTTNPTYASGVKSNKPTISVQISNDTINTGATVSILGRLGNKPTATVYDIAETLTVNDVSIATDFTLTKPGTWYFKPVLTDSGKSYEGRDVPVVVNEADILTSGTGNDITQTDIDGDGNVNSEVFSLPTAGNYVGREHVTCGMRFVCVMTERGLAWNRVNDVSATIAALEERIKNLENRINYAFS